MISVSRPLAGPAYGMPMQPGFQRMMPTAAGYPRQLAIPQAVSPFPGGFASMQVSPRPVVQAAPSAIGSSPVGASTQSLGSPARVQWAANGVSAPTYQPSTVQASASPRPRGSVTNGSPTVERTPSAPRVVSAAQPFASPAVATSENTVPPKKKTVGFGLRQSIDMTTGVGSAPKRVSTVVSSPPRPSVIVAQAPAGAFPVPRKSQTAAEIAPAAAQAVASFESSPQGSRYSMARVSEFWQDDSIDDEQRAACERMRQRRMLLARR